MANKRCLLLLIGALLVLGTAALRTELRVRQRVLAELESRHPQVIPSGVDDDDDDDGGDDGGGHAGGTGGDSTRSSIGFHRSSSQPLSVNILSEVGTLVQQGRYDQARQALDLLAGVLNDIDQDKAKDDAQHSEEQNFCSTALDQLQRELEDQKSIAIEGNKRRSELSVEIDAVDQLLQKLRSTLDDLTKQKQDQEEKRNAASELFQQEVVKSQNRINQWQKDCDVVKNLIGLLSMYVDGVPEGSGFATPSTDEPRPAEPSPSPSQPGSASQEHLPAPEPSGAAPPPPPPASEAYPTAVSGKSPSARDTDPPEPDAAPPEAPGHSQQPSSFLEQFVQLRLRHVSSNSLAHLDSAAGGSPPGLSRGSELLALLQDLHDKLTQWIGDEQRSMQAAAAAQEQLLRDLDALPSDLRASIDQTKLEIQKNEAKDHDLRQLDDQQAASMAASSKRAAELQQAVDDMRTSCNRQESDYQVRKSHREAERSIIVQLTDALKQLLGEAAPPEVPSPGGSPLPPVPSLPPLPSLPWFPSPSEGTSGEGSAPPSTPPVASGEQFTPPPLSAGELQDQGQKKDEAPPAPPASEEQPAAPSAAPPAASGEQFTPPPLSAGELQDQGQKKDEAPPASGEQPAAPPAAPLAAPPAASGEQFTPPLLSAGELQDQGQKKDEAPPVPSAPSDALPPPPPPAASGEQPTTPSLPLGEQFAPPPLSAGELQGQEQKKDETLSVPPDSPGALPPPPPVASGASAAQFSASPLSAADLPSSGHPSGDGANADQQPSGQQLLDETLQEPKEFPPSQEQGPPEAAPELFRPLTVLPRLDSDESGVVVSADASSSALLPNDPMHEQP